MDIDIDIALVEEPIVVPDLLIEGAGAVVRFEGRVRGHEKGESIDALFYEAHAPMAKKQMEKIAHELNEEHPCLAVRVRHRLGLVPVGEASIVVDICSRHRREAFVFLSEFMDRLKEDVPIWKAVA